MRHSLIQYKPFFFFLLLSLVINRLAAQPENLPLHHTLFSLYEKQIYAKGSGIHTAVKPLLRSELEQEGVRLGNDTGRGFFHGHAFSRGGEKGRWGLDPLINFLPYAVSEDGRKPYVDGYLSAGLALHASFAKKVYFRVNYLYSDAGYTSLLQRSIADREVIPGLGRSVPLGDDLFVNHYTDGYLSYSPNSIFNFQLGMGRHFFGDGYRSLLLSDYAFSYPYFRMTTSFWKIKYVNLYAMQFDPRNAAHPFVNAATKFSSTHFLSMNIGKRWNIGLFESVIWRGKDSSYHRNFDVNYLNPVIFFRPVEYSVGSPDNVLIGLNASYKLFRHQLIYGQLLIDEFLLDELRARSGWWANKYAFQLGMKSFVGQHLTLQAEYNFARPYTYTHSSVLQNYAHFNRPLAHPLGANFKEVVVLARYRIGNLIPSARLILASYGVGNDTLNVGQNIFISSNSREKDYDNFTTQGLNQHTLFADIGADYLLNSQTGLMLTAGLRLQTYSSKTAPWFFEEAAFVYLGIRTPIMNSYQEN